LQCIHAERSHRQQRDRSIAKRQRCCAWQLRPRLLGDPNNSVGGKNGLHIPQEVFASSAKAGYAAREDEYKRGDPHERDQEAEIGAVMHRRCDEFPSSERLEHQQANHTQAKRAPSKAAVDKQ
jgi:hypothetical protein